MLGLTFTPAIVRAADHADAPTVGGDQGADLADIYAFLDPNDNEQVILINTIRGFIVPGEAGNFALFDEDVRYTFQIENTGDSKPDFFIDVNFNGRQVPPVQVKGAVPNIPGFDVPRTSQDALISFRGKVPANLAGSKGRSHAPVTQPTLAASPLTETLTDLTNAKGDSLNIKFFAGEQDDPFFFDIPAFVRFAATARAQTAGTGTLDPTLLNRGRDTFAGYNVMTIAMRMPASILRGTGTEAPTKIGISCTASRKTEHSVKGEKVGSGGYTTVDREGLPGVNALFIPYNRKNAFNGGSTVGDGKGEFFADIAGTLTALGTNSGNIATLASIVGLPPVFPIPKNGTQGRGDMLLLETDSTVAPNTGSGANGFPNGRRPADDVIDIVLGLVTNGAITTGDNVNANDVAFRTVFPFLAPPNQPLANGATDNTKN